jgi:8-oxo-dGTP pyrophosphatase MutT (NUDIX family)
MSFLDRIATCNTRDLAGFRPWFAEGRHAGWLRRAFAERLLADWPQQFAERGEALVFGRAAKDSAGRTAAMAEIVATLADTGVVPRLREERYAVTDAWGRAPMLEIDRAAVPSFGVRAYGVHMNGYVRHRDRTFMWIARRNPDKPTWPGRLDNMVAGGQPAGLGLFENLIKEAHEEAGLSAIEVQGARPVGAITYAYENAEGLKPDTQFCFDLELPFEFVPEPQDHEVAGFDLVPIEEVARIVRDTEEFKPNCDLVIIDFLLRHGFLSPDEEPDYAAIAQGLRTKLPEAAL